MQPASSLPARSPEQKLQVDINLTDTGCAVAPAPQERFHTEVHRFGKKFSHLTEADFWEPGSGLRSDPEFTILRQVILKMIARMDEMNRYGRGIPNDSVKSLLLKLTRPSSIVVTLEESDSKGAPGSKTVKGFGIVIANPKDCPDFEDWPEALKAENPARLYRLVVDPDAKLCGAHTDSSCNRIIEEAVREVEPKRLLALILMGGHPEEEKLHPTWLEARDSLIPKGFEDTGYAHIHTFKHRDSQDVCLFFEWHMFPPQSEAAKKAQWAYQARFSRQQLGWQRRLAEISPHVPPTGARILCFGGNRVDGHELGAMFPGNYIVDACTGKHSYPKPGLERLGNVRIIEEVDPALYSFGNEVFDLIYDPLREGKEEGLSRGDKLARAEATIMNQAAQLKTYGCLIWHKMVASAGRDGAENGDDLSAANLERIMLKAGLRVVCSHPEFPEEQSSLDGRPAEKSKAAAALCWRIVAQKAPSAEGVEIVEKYHTVSQVPAFLKVASYLASDGSVREIIEHGKTNLVAVPWFEDQKGDEYVVLKASYPRPIGVTGSQPVDGSMKRAFNDEAIAQFGIPAESDFKHTVLEVLQQKALIEPEDVKSINIDSASYFTAPRDFDDHVRSVQVRIKPLEGKRHPLYDGLESRPTVQALKARHVLRVCQRGGMTDAWLERAVYKLILSRGTKVGSWIGADLNFRTQGVEALPHYSPAEIFPLESPLVFKRLNTEKPREWEVRQGRLVEKDAAGTELACIELEYASRTEESGRGTNAVSVLPVLRLKDRDGKEEVYAAVQMLESPAAENRLGCAHIASAITFDLPEAEKVPGDYTKTRLKERFGVETLNMTQVGEPYFAAPRISARRILPVAAEVTLESVLKSGLKLVPLKSLLTNEGKIRCGNLLTLTYRISHACLGRAAVKM